MLLKYHGGKHYLAPKILSIFRPHSVYAEPCVGGASMFFAKQDIPVYAVKHNVLCDLNPFVINFWHFVQNHPDVLHKALSAVKWGKDTFEVWEGSPTELLPMSHPNANLNNVLAAMRTFIVSRMSRGGLGRDFSASTRLRGGRDEGENAFSGAVGRLFIAAKVLRDATLRCQNALATVEAYKDVDGGLIYLDPPYVGATRVAPNAYAFEMDDSTHLKLLTLCQNAKAKIIISGYNCPMYTEMLAGWTRYRFDVKNRAGQSKELSEAIEYVWVNK